MSLSFSSNDCRSFRVEELEAASDSDHLEIDEGGSEKAVLSPPFTGEGDQPPLKSGWANSLRIASEPGDESDRSCQTAGSKISDQCFSAVFPISLCVRDSQGFLWRVAGLFPDLKFALVYEARHSNFRLFFI